ncbi:dihydrodipicolinate synthase family protein [Quadrisphaera setariae]|uniref:Dihydrodipicolinate synthase family protein n=1 Tax=Quadrisphaera setariae TaxID=2593304 RepID=A0A5C8ZLZ6_9ACTN|nr:dihydrodipicolinate synthase family protein [Quadrisphaera setariae]TXR58006.1 dihydrodipicolinate synthase family protein [Quadrisphaera setariae]
MTDHLISAVPVPFTADGALDESAFEKVLATLEPHVDAVLVAGTTGEFPALDDDERVGAFRTAVAVLGAPRVIAHVGHASSRQVLRVSAAARELGVDRLALLNPYYLPTDDAGTVAFFAALSAEHADADLYGYFFPERTGAVVPVDVVAQVLALPGMAGMKLSGGASTLLAEHLAVARPGQSVWSGDDATFGKVLAAGGTGVVSGVSALFPQTFGALRRALVEGDATEAERLQAVVERVVGLTGPSVARLKTGLSLRTGSPWAARMAQPAVGPELRDEIAAAVAEHA